MSKSVLLGVIVTYLCVSVPMPAQEIKPGEPVQYAPMRPEIWKQKETSIMLYPWEGKEVVVLTTKNDLDPKIMGIFLNKLDAGWEMYSKLMPRKPTPYHLIHGKPVIAMVPDASFTCGMGCGNIGATGIEIAGFYREHFGGPGDYARVKRDPTVFQHYYFYEMGRNWYQFEGRHSSFTTGFAVFMRNVGMDTVKATRMKTSARGVPSSRLKKFTRSTETFNETFAGHLGRQGNKLVDKNGKPIGLTDINCMYASVMLKLRRENGGDAWVKRFYHHLLECPEGGFKQQTWNWVVCASCAAGQDLTPLFVTRWRCPIPEKVQQALARINWKDPELSAYKVLLSLPIEEMPPVLAVNLPGFITDSMKSLNLLADASFEDDGKDLWKRRSFLRNGKAISISTDEAQHGRKSVHITSTQQDDVCFFQKVPVKAKTSYALCGWIKTRDVVVREKGGMMGANLFVDGTNWKTRSITGTNDWTYVGIMFNSETRTEVSVGARLGYTASTSTGEAWFDNMYLVEVPRQTPVTPPVK